MTVVYQFPDTPSANALRDTLAIEFGNFNARVLQDLTVVDRSITVVLEYRDSADFTENVLADFEHVIELNNAGVTRTITYSLVPTE
jgi:hypothetical protein